MTEKPNRRKFYNGENRYEEVAPSEQMAPLVEVLNELGVEAWQNVRGDYQNLEYIGFMNLDEAKRFLKLLDERRLADTEESWNGVECYYPLFARIVGFDHESWKFELRPVDPSSIQSVFAKRPHWVPFDFAVRVGIPWADVPLVTAKFQRTAAIRKEKSSGGDPPP